MVEPTRNTAGAPAWLSSRRLTAGLLVLALALRLVYAHGLPLNVDEGQHLNVASQLSLHPDRFHLPLGSHATSHPILSVVLIALARWVGGGSIFFIRVVFVLVSAAGLVGFFLLVRALFGAGAANVALLVVATFTALFLAGPKFGYASPCPRKALAGRIQYYRYFEEGDPEAQEELRGRLDRTVERDPDCIAAWVFKGRLARTPSERQEAFRAAQARDPANPLLGWTLAKDAEERGDWAEARRLLQEALDAGHDFAALRVELARAEYRLGNLARDEAHIDRAVAINPDYARALEGLARLLAACPDAEVRDPAGAVAAAERLCELSGGREAAHLVTLADAYAASGRTEDALDAAEKALAIAEAAGHTGLAGRIRRQIMHYAGVAP